MSSVIQSLTAQYCFARRVSLHGAHELLRVVGNAMPKFKTPCEIFCVYMGVCKSTSEFIINQLTITFQPAVHLQTNNFSSTLFITK
jgi:hypothetical protein